MIKRLRKRNRKDYFSNDNIIMLMLSGDKEVFRNLEKEFLPYLYSFAFYVLKDREKASKAAQGAIYDLAANIKNEVPIENYIADLYALCRIRVVVQITTTKNKDYVKELKDHLKEAEQIIEIQRLTQLEGGLKNIRIVL